MANNENQTVIENIVNEIEKLLISNPNLKAIFKSHVDRLCEMVENYGQAQQPYSEQLEKAREEVEKFTPKQLEKHKSPDGKIRVSLVDICPPPKGYVKMNYWDNQFINVPIGTIFRPEEPGNPLLWFDFCNHSIKERKPTEGEKLMCKYVILAIVHDYQLRCSVINDNPIFPHDYKGQWFQWDNFCKATYSYYYSEPNHLKLALEHIIPEAKVKEVFELKPHFNGIGVDLKALWKKLWNKK